MQKKSACSPPRQTFLASEGLQAENVSHFPPAAPAGTEFATGGPSFEFSRYDRGQDPSEGRKRCDSCDRLRAGSLRRGAGALRVGLPVRGYRRAAPAALPHGSGNPHSERGPGRLRKRCPDRADLAFRPDGGRRQDGSRREAGPPPRRVRREELDAADSASPDRRDRDLGLLLEHRHDGRVSSDHDRCGETRQRADLQSPDAPRLRFDPLEPRDPDFELHEPARLGRPASLRPGEDRLLRDGPGRAGDHGPRNALPAVSRSEAHSRPRQRRDDRALRSPQVPDRGRGHAGVAPFRKDARRESARRRHEPGRHRDHPGREEDAGSPPADDPAGGRCPDPRGKGGGHPLDQGRRGHRDQAGGEALGSGSGFRGRPDGRGDGPSPVAPGGPDPAGVGVSGADRPDRPGACTRRAGPTARTRFLDSG